MIKAIIYKHTCIVNDKSYIGFTTRDIETRWCEHVKLSMLGSKFHFHNAIRKYGEANFTHEILVEIVGEDEKEMYKLEQEYIKKYDTYNKGYNSTKGGEGCLGLLVNEETKEKLRKAALKENLSPEKLLKMRNAKLGKKLSLQTKEKLSLIKKGLIFTEEHKTNLSNRKKEFYLNNENKIKAGDYHSKEYILINKEMNIELKIDNLKKYCLENELNYKKIHKTIKSQHCTRDGWLAIPY